MRAVVQAGLQADTAPGRAEAIVTGDRALLALRRSLEDLTG